MSNVGRALLVAYVGAVAGALGLSIATVLLGVLLGSVTGLVVHQARRRQWARAGWIATVGSLWIAPSWFAAAALTMWGTWQLGTRR